MTHTSHRPQPTQPTRPPHPTRPVRPPSHPFDVPAASHAYLARSAASLSEAVTTTEVPLRYAQAHVAALRATAALLAARATPLTGRQRRPAQKNAWVLLAEVAPELAEWAAFFSAGAAKRAAAEAGSVRAVTEREADDLVRDAGAFLAVVAGYLGQEPARPRPRLVGGTGTDSRQRR